MVILYKTHSNNTNSCSNDSAISNKVNPNTQKGKIPFIIGKALFQESTIGHSTLYIRIIKVSRLDVLTYTLGARALRCREVAITEQPSFYRPLGGVDIHRCRSLIAADRNKMENKGACSPG